MSLLSSGEALFGKGAGGGGGGGSQGGGGGGGRAAAPRPPMPTKISPAMMEEAAKKVGVEGWGSGSRWREEGGELEGGRS